MEYQKIFIDAYIKSDFKRIIYLYFFEKQQKIKCFLIINTYLIFKVKMVNVRLGSKNYVQIQVSKLYNLLKILTETKKDEAKGNAKKIETVTQTLQEIVDAYNELQSKKDKKPTQMSGYNNFIKQLKVPEGENIMKYGGKVWNNMSEEEKKKYQ